MDDPQLRRDVFFRHISSLGGGVGHRKARHHRGAKGRCKLDGIDHIAITDRMYSPGPKDFRKTGQRSAASKRECLYCRA